jgi:hypothetical protein
MRSPLLTLIVAGGEAATRCTSWWLARVTNPDRALREWSATPAYWCDRAGCARCWSWYR